MNLQLVYRYILSLSKNKNMFYEKKKKKKMETNWPIYRYGGHIELIIGAPKRSTNMASPYKALQRCEKHFDK